VLENRASMSSIASSNAQTDFAAIQQETKRAPHGKLNMASSLKVDSTPAKQPGKKEKAKKLNKSVVLRKFDVKKLTML
jgi:hypothetical protein